MPFSINAQTPDLFWTSGVLPDENIHELTIDHEGRVLVGATFEDGLLSLSGAGGTDLALIQLSPEGTIQWQRHFGSTLNDEWAGLTTDAADNIYAAGSFWIELQIDTLTFSAEKNAKALFLSKFSSDGSLQWAQKIEGSGIKVVHEIAIDNDGGLLLTGYFSDTLFLGAPLMIANGRTDLFAARFLANGQLDWAMHAGYTLDTRAESLTPLPGGAVALTGYYNDTTLIGTDTLIANTFDRDVFVCLLDNRGEPQWARRAGGVHDDEVTAIRYAANGQLYLTGYLIGVINLSDTLSIQSATGNSDFYLIAYDTAGTAQTARAYGGQQIQQTTGLKFRDDQLWVSGFYQGEMTIDGQKVNAGNGIGSFLARFDLDLQLQQLYNFPSEDNFLINALAFDSDDRLFFGGGYTGRFTVGGQTLTSTGGFDLFLNQIWQATPTESALYSSIDITVFPNPAVDQFFIKTTLDYEEIRLANLQGQTVYRSAQPETTVVFRQLPAGLYVLLLYKDGQTWRIPVVVSGKGS